MLSFERKGYNASNIRYLIMALTKCTPDLTRFLSRSHLTNFKRLMKEIMGQVEILDTNCDDLCTISVSGSIDHIDTTRIKTHNGIDMKRFLSWKLS